MPTDDRDLIEAMQAGDDLAFVSLYNRYKHQVYGFCLKMLLDEERAADVMQDTFLRVYENRDRLLNTSSFRSWLFTIARNQCLNVIRREKRQVAMEPQMKEEASVKASRRPGASLEKSEQVELVNRYLAQLKPDYREVIILREYQNLSYKEIAGVTRSTLSAVKSRLFKARRKLGFVYQTGSATRTGASSGRYPAVAD